MISGPNLPQELRGHSMVPLEAGGLAILGGFGNSNYQDKIYHFRCSNLICTITTLSKKLSIPRMDFVAIPIPENVWSECIQ